MFTAHPGSDDTSCTLFFVYLTSIFLATAVASAKHSGSDHGAVGADAGFLAHQADIHLLKDITDLTWGGQERAKHIGLCCTSHTKPLPPSRLHSHLLLEETPSR